MVNSTEPPRNAKHLRKPSKCRTLGGVDGVLGHDETKVEGESSAGETLSDSYLASGKISVIRDVSSPIQEEPSRRRIWETE